MLNTIIIMGRLTKTPETKTTSNNVTFCQFTVAVDREMAKDKTDFIPCVAWRGSAEFLAKYFTKGQMVCCEGRLENNPFTTDDGKKRDSWSVNVQSIHFCGGKQAAGEFTPVNVKFEELGDDDGELPF